MSAKIAIFFTLLILGALIYHSAAAVVKPEDGPFDCPDGQGWACWGNRGTRNDNCIGNDKVYISKVPLAYLISEPYYFF